MKGTKNVLNDIRKNKDQDKLVSSFNMMAKKNIRKTKKIINDERLEFTTLYTIKKELERFKLNKDLNPRNKIALQLINEIKDKKTNIVTECDSIEHIQRVQSTLKWILNTGLDGDGLENEYDEILDLSYILLIKVYNDITYSPKIVDVIFKRYKRGFYIYDLVWALYESCDIDSLFLIAKYLLSENQKEFKLACRLLNFIPAVEKINNKNKRDYYPHVIKWIKRNSPYLYYTGESFQQTSRPKVYAISMEAKYLNKEVSKKTGEILHKLNKRETRLLNEFKKLSGYNKEILSNYSSTLYTNNLYQWNNFISYPLIEQIEYVKKRLGGIL
ncbi:MAG: hypothetical protein FH753_13835 [Firmicutes bacterium]|nr:hypothetical protein [Bacillota bacterium]